MIFSIVVYPLMSHQDSINIIRNINNLCPYHCDICLVNAKYVPLWVNEFNTSDYWVNNWSEISLENKLKIIQNLDYPNVKIDVSGWEPLLFSEWLEVLKNLSDKFWRDKIALTSTWAWNIDFSMKNMKLLESYIWNIDFTYDWAEDLPYRPNNYSQNNLLFASKFSRSVNKTAQIVITSQNISSSNIKRTIMELKANNIDNIFLIKFYPIGRWANYKDLLVPVSIARQAIDEYISFSKQHDGPTVAYQKTLLGWKIGTTSGCSFFINERWELFSNAWMKDILGKDNYDYKIWNLVNSSFVELCWKNYKEIKILQNRYNWI